MPVQTLIQVRQSLAETWTSTNPTLAVGEFGYETDTKKLKIGTGALWNNTLYTNDVTLGGTGRTDGVAPPFIYYANNGDFTMTEAGQAAGTVTSTGSAKYFGVGANLAANTTYEVDVYLPLVFTTVGSSQPRLNTTHTNGLTLYGSNFTNTTEYATTETAMTAQTRAVRYTAQAGPISTSTQTVTGLTTATTYYLKTYLKGIIRTNAGGTWSVFYNPSANSTTSTTLRDGAFMKFTPIASGTASPASIGTFV